MSPPRILRLWVLLALALAACGSPPKDTVRTDPGEAATTDTSEPRETVARPPLRSPSRPPRAAPPAPSRPTGGDAILATAHSYLGVPYRYGGNDRRGLDCSALVVSVFAEHDISVPRTSAGQFAATESVDPADVRAGDLVFFTNARGQVNHVGIYAGRGRFIHASTGKRQVRYDSLTSSWFRKRYAGARRVVTTLAR